MVNSGKLSLRPSSVIIVVLTNAITFSTSWFVHLFIILYSTANSMSFFLDPGAAIGAGINDYARLLPVQNT